MGKLAELFTGNIADSAAKILSLFKVDPNLKAANEEKLAEIQAELLSKQMDAATVEIQAASANIRADAESGDKFTARARPSFMYIIELILFWNYIVAPLLGKTVLVLPDSLFWLFGSAILGYTGARSWDKFMGTEGDSTVSLPFGIKASQITNGRK
jgi:hypothetical protein